ncbi:hypothetical protein DS2_01460 [Catenovulum agarivorans DS-2]|uniref:Cytoskeleton protein RodZ-like C-terminal domain-containing protein n=1 Tax=Catenovulum agarivorans DS-2 TaxID=1328313 RepID=W7QTJ3_9ALTE|nr:RodZ domain-containing protein [Catenovulum agarivorans]EWH12347.1 hypothetical protein DS2_01460 [Catenovulum agarivorans DS-2]
MTDLIEQPHNSAEDTTNVSVGLLLQQTRVKQGLSEQDVAGSLNLKVSIIQGIENDDFSTVAVPTYIKGYLRAYAKLLSLDEQAVIALYYQQQPVEYNAENKLKSFSKKTSQQAHDNRLMLVTYGIVLILIALIVVWWFQREAVVQTAEDNQSVEQVKLEPELAEINEPAELVESITNEEPIKPIKDVAEQTPVNLTPQQETSVSTQVSESANYNLELTFRGDCWINILDATGERVAFGVKEKGRVIKLDAIPPYQITLGAPEVVDIVFQQDNLDMSQFKQGMVARFSLPLGHE